MVILGRSLVHVYQTPEWCRLSNTLKWIKDVNPIFLSHCTGDKLDDIGCLKVDEFLRVEGYTDVFAIGDCSTADSEAKMAFKAGCHADVVAKNLKMQETGEPLKKYSLCKSEIYKTLKLSKETKHRTKLTFSVKPSISPCHNDLTIFFTFR